jgi:pimeloyl-ACP methyl ester carboxylesterase
MAHLDIRGARFEYVEKGEGAPLVLVHGSASDYRTWEHQHEELARHFRTIVYSRRYHWPNEPIAEDVDYSMHEHVEDLGALVKALDAEPAHLVGHSYGAFLCLLLAIREPNFVRSLVLAEPPVITLFVSAEPKPMELLKLLVTRPRTARAIMTFGAQGIRRATRAFRAGDTETGLMIFGDAIFGLGGYRRMPEQRKRQVQDNASTVKGELLGSGLASLDPDDVRGVRTPTLLIRAENSIGLFHRLTDRLEELLPNARRVEVSSSLHSMHRDNPPAFNAAVLEFLRSVDE